MLRYCCIFSLFLLLACGSKVSSVEEVESFIVGTWEGWESCTVGADAIDTKIVFTADDRYEQYVKVNRMPWSYSRSGTYTFGSDVFEGGAEEYFYVSIAFSALGEVFHETLVFKDSKKLHLYVHGSTHCGVFYKE